MDNKIVKLAIYRFAHRAEILKEKLSENGIDCFISEDTSFGNLLGVSVFVFENDFQKAKNIYDELSL